MKSAAAVALRGQDLLVALKLAVDDKGVAQSLRALGGSLGLSASETKNALSRAGLAGLVNEQARAPRRTALLEFMVHGARYAFPGVRGRRARGIETGPSAPPLSDHLIVDPDEQWVWPYAQGAARGESVAPLYRSAPEAAFRDPKLYELLVLLDGVRLGSPRVRKVAIGLLEERLA